jgi:hypothetical protein
MTQQVTLNEKVTGNQVGAAEWNQIVQALKGQRELLEVLVDGGIKFKYNAASEKVEIWLNDDLLFQANKQGTKVMHSLETGVGSLILGGVFTIGSGGERVLVVDRQTNEAYVVGGTKLDNGGAQATVQQQLVVKQLITPVIGGSPQPQSTAATWTEAPAGNAIIYSNTLVAAEDYTGQLSYRTTIVESGILAVSFDIDASFLAGDEVRIDYTYPVIAPKGVQVRVEITKEDGSPLLVAQGTTFDQAYRATRLRPYDERPLYDASLISGFDTIFLGGIYIVDCTAGEANITVSRDQGMTAFRIHDFGSTFSNSNPCNLLFGGTTGTFKLRHAKDSYEFYWTGANWRYIDLNSGQGGLVQDGVESVSNDITFGDGLKKAGNSITLAKAGVGSGEKIGGIKIGTGLAITEDGTVSATASSESTVTVANETEMLALPISAGGYRVNRTDLEQIYYLNSGDNPATLGNWIAGPSTALAVLTWNNRNGSVMPQNGDYTMRQIKVVHDDSGAEGFFGIDNNGIYFDPSF